MAWTARGLGGRGRGVPRGPRSATISSATDRCRARGPTFDLGPKDTAKIETTSAPGLTRALHVVVGASAPNERHAVLQRWFVPGAATTLMARFAFRTSDTTRHMNLANLLLRDTPKTPSTTSPSPSISRTTS